MATITFNPLVAVDFTLINTTRTTIDATVATSYAFDSSAGDIDIEGSALTYDASNNAVSGTMTRIDLDLNSDQGASNGGDINISGLNITAPADLAAIDNGAFSLLGIALQGNDIFLLAGMNEDLDTPTATNRVFGDDLSNSTFFLSGSTNTNIGGGDTFSGGDNRIEVSGDVWSLNSSAAASTYTGGNDNYFAVITEELNRIAGDAWTIDRTGAGQMTLNGGNDTIDLGGNTSSTSFISGDVVDMNNGIVNGGDDLLISDDSSSPEVSGDVRTYNGGTLNGGDDVISLANFGRAGGDVMFLNSPIPSGVFTLTGGADEITGGSQDDIIGGEVHDRNSTIDNLIVGGDDVIFGGAGDDDLFGEVAFGDAVIGVSGGDDVIFGGEGNDELRGQTGEDILDGGIGNDTIDGGTGDDTVSYATARAGVTVNLLVAGAQNTIGAGIDSLFGLENLTGSRYDDTLRGGNGANELDGGAGADRIFSGNGEDSVFGGAGSDIVNSVGQTGDALSGGSGDDILESDGGGNLLAGNGGIDTVSFASVTLDTTIDLAAGQARQNGASTADLLFQIENVIGGGGRDRITGTAGANVLNGGGGKDVLIGDAGDDTLDGGDLGDILRGGDGNDRIFGGAGVDELGGGRDDDALNGGDSGDTLIGDRGFDILAGEGGNDTVSGGDDDDTITGGDGADTLSGDEGIDTLSGDEGADTLDGGGGNDILIGGTGGDLFTGGGGADTMVFAPADGTLQDRILDFEDTGAISDDLIDVTAYGFASVASITATASGNDVLLDLGGVGRVRLVDYLLTHQLSEIDPSDFLI